METALVEENAGVDTFRRPPDRVMRLARLGCSYPTRLSFMRSLLRRMQREAWRIERERWDLDANGFGAAVYAVHTPLRSYRLVCFANELAPEDRTDRVIAEKWDTSFALVDGPVTDADIVRLQANVPRQEAGRVSPRELVLSRANKSVRLFEHVVESLAAGRQPALARLAEVGYLMRTTAVYGNGKFGLSDFDRVRADCGFTRPFEAEMLTVYLIRLFTVDLVEQIAAARGGGVAVRLGRKERRALGVGNSTGLGMAPFLINHPVLIDRWFSAREEAFARVRALERAGPGEVERFRSLLARARRHVAEWRTPDRRFTERITMLAGELARFEAVAAEPQTFSGAYPWDALCRRAERDGSIELQELLHSLTIEPYGALVDDLEDGLGDPGDRHNVCVGVTVSELAARLRADYGWALGIDFDDPAETHLFWYVSEEKEEPRLGERWSEPGAERESRLGVGRAAKGLAAVLDTVAAGEPELSVAEFLLRHPEQRWIAARVLTLMGHPYGEIRDNVLGRDCVPIDLLRAKLAYFGAHKFDPKSDRWTRICLFQGAPYPDEIDAGTVEDWVFPVVGPAQSGD